jgi:hypothetical protein
MKKNKYANGGYTPKLDSSILSQSPNATSFVNNLDTISKSQSVNTSSIGGSSGGPGIGGYAQMGSTAIELFGGMAQDLSGKKHKEVANIIEQSATDNLINNTSAIHGINTNDSMMDVFKQDWGMDGHTIKKKSAIQAVGDNLMSSAKGAAAGAAAGPWGALIGGIVGGVTDLVGQIGGNAQRKKAQKRIDSATDRYNNMMNATLNKQLSVVDSKNDKLAMSNMFEFGGFIPMASMAIESDLMNKSLAIQNLSALNKGKAAGIPASPKLFKEGGLMPSTDLFAALPDATNKSHGSIFDLGLPNTVGAGGSHTGNPNGGVQVGVDPNGVPNLVEENEVIYNDYVFSNSLSLDDVNAKNNTLNKKYIGKTYADIARELNKEAEQKPNDPIVKATLEDALNRLMVAQEEERAVSEIAEMNKESNMFASGGQLDKWLQAAPIVGSAVQAGTDMAGITNRNDYSHINDIDDPASTPLISPERIGNYMQYTPLDKDYYLNRQAAQTAATRAAMMNASNGNRGALVNSLLAVDMQGNLAAGQLARQAVESDINQKMQVANFNRATNMFNSQQEMQAAAQNSSTRRYDNQIKMQMEMNKANMKQQVDNMASAARSNNLSTFLNNIGNYGRERIAMNAINSNPGLYYKWNEDGSITYKNGYENLPAEQKAIVNQNIEATRAGNMKKCGGKLKIKA